MTKKIAAILVVALVAGAGLGIWRKMSAGPSGPVQTFIFGANAQGDVVGAYTYSHFVPRANPQFLNSNFVLHGFLWHRGTFTAIDDPRAGTYTPTIAGSPLASPSGGTEPQGINDQGDVVGCYLDSHGRQHGFLWHQGTFTTIDGPKGSGQTCAEGIDARGDIVGFYAKPFTWVHGFLWRQGTFTTIDWYRGASIHHASDSATISATFTDAHGINAQGDIAGIYEPFNGQGHGFVWHQGAAFTTIAAPQAKGETQAQGINDQGDIAGYYEDATNPRYAQIDDPSADQFDADFHGFLRHQGAFTIINAPHAQETAATGINAQGDVVGYYQEASHGAGSYHGFLWHRGAFTTIDWH